MNHFCTIILQASLLPLRHMDCDAVCKPCYRNRGPGEILAPVGEILGPVGKILTPVGTILAPVGKIQPAISKTWRGPDQELDQCCDVCLLAAGSCVMHVYIFFHSPRTPCFAGKDCMLFCSRCILRHTATWIPRLSSLPNRPCRRLQTQSIVSR
jgi:hypothetical protein